MAHAYETRHRRNGAIDLRDDVNTLGRDFTQLTDDLGSIFTQKWNGVGERLNGGFKRAAKEVRARPFVAIGAAAGAGMLAGVLVTALARRRK
ncbi:hypothetical protein [Candidatus Viadribacter manganicus]|uniref:DUF883 domain-containing protein n=1 Tax=Candidatus Viadribacter manganicus TaxID=1759059 RepID=A0A1B1AIH2_9PROT|nr:hypothetical protein [Candidatus Viadribacter manganicus]ANP46341.1 hypothetical protein ATE48_10655 [Candidatus Viadribacter manganicus]